MLSKPEGVGWIDAIGRHVARGARGGNAGGKDRHDPFGDMRHQDSRVFTVFHQALQIQPLARLDGRPVTELAEYQMAEHGMGHEDQGRRGGLQGLELGQIRVALAADLQDFLVEGSLGRKMPE